MSALWIAVWGALVLAYLAVRAARWPPPPAWLPAWGRGGVLSARLAAFEHVSPRHAEEARAHARDFEALFQRTFELAHNPAEAVRALFARRASVLQALHELRMRLPNDLDMERGLAAATEDSDRLMLEHIEDARQRTGAPLLHPGPLDGAWFSRWYRAANDDIA